MMTVGGNCGNKNICCVFFFAFLFAQFIKHPAATTLTTNQPNSARVACFIIKSLDTIMLQNGHLTLY